MDNIFSSVTAIGVYHCRDESDVQEFYRKLFNSSRSLVEFTRFQTALVCLEGVCLLLICHPPVVTFFVSRLCLCFCFPSRVTEKPCPLFACGSRVASYGVAALQMLSCGISIKNKKHRTML